MSFLRRFRSMEDEEAPPPVVRKPRREKPADTPAETPAYLPGEVSLSPRGEGESLLGPGLRWEGTLQGQGRVRLEGHFQGVIRVQGEVTVGPQGRVIVEEIEALTVVIAGLLQGPVKAKHVVLKHTGRLHGDVVTTSLEAEAGGFLKGRVQMEERLTFSWEGSQTEPRAPTTPPPEAPMSPMPAKEVSEDGET